MQFELQPFVHLITQGIAIQLLRPIVGQFGQVVSLQLDSVEFIVTAQLLDFGIGLLFAQDDIAIFILRKFIEQLLFRQLLPIELFRAKRFGNRKRWHDGTMVDGIELHLVCNLQGVAQCLRNIGKDSIHLGRCLHPLLLGVAHTCRIVQILSRAQTDQAVMCLGILGIGKVHVIRRNQLHLIFLGQLDQHLIDLLLLGEDGTIRIRIMRLMPLHLQIIVIAKQLFEPTDRFLRLFHMPLHNQLRNLAT